MLGSPYPHRLRSRGPQTRTSSRRSTDRLKDGLQIDVSQVQATTRAALSWLREAQGAGNFARQASKADTACGGALAARLWRSDDVLDDRRARRTSLARALSLGFELAAKYLGAVTTGLTRRIAALPKSQILNDSGRTLVTL